MLVAAAVALVTTESIVLPVGLPQRWLAGDGSSPSPLPRTRRGPAPENLGPRVGLARARGPGPSFGRRTGAPQCQGWAGSPLIRNGTVTMLDATPRSLRSAASMRPSLFRSGTTFGASL